MPSAAPGTATSTPSVSTMAASMPSNDVPLIRPMTLRYSAIRVTHPPLFPLSYTMPTAPSFRSEFLRTFVERGAYYDCSAPQELDALFAKERVTAYIGFDCTASSMHIGNLVQLMTLRRLQQAGHRPILLMGGGTTKLGDPSGRDGVRKLLTSEQIDANKQSMVAGVSHLLKFGDGPSDAIMVDNAEWLRQHR